MVGNNPWLVSFGRIFYRLRDNAGERAGRGRIFEAARGWVAKVIARGQSLGVVRTDLPPALLIDCAMGLLEALDRWGVAHWEEIDRNAWPGTASLHIDLLRRLLAPA